MKASSHDVEHDTPRRGACHLLVSLGLVALLGCGSESEEEPPTYEPAPPKGTELTPEGEALVLAALDPDCKGDLADLDVDSFRSRDCLEGEPDFVATENLLYGSLVSRVRKGCGPVGVVELASDGLASTNAVYVSVSAYETAETCERTVVTIAVWVDRGEGFVLDEFTAEVGVKRADWPMCFLASVDGGPSTTDRVSDESTSGNVVVVSLHDDPTVERLRVVVGAISGCFPIPLDFSFYPEREVYDVEDNGE